MTTTPTDADNQDTTTVDTDKTWENRSIVLAALAPRSTSRPARRSAPAPDDAATEPTAGDDAKAPGLVSRGAHALGRGIRAGAGRVAAKIPPNRRLGAAVLAAVVLIVFVMALGIIRTLATENAPSAATQTRSAPPTPPPTAATPKEVILTGITAKDSCPKDNNEPYAPTNDAFDGNLGTAWICTRADGKDDQYIQMDFGRQVTATKIRIDPGFDARIPDTPDGVDQWPNHHIVTKLEVYFPKELQRPPLLIDTGGVRDFQTGFIDPPATVSKLLIKIIETVKPPQPSDAATDNTATSASDDITTVAVSEIQILGYSN